MGDLAPLFALLPRLEAGDATLKYTLIKAIAEAFGGHPYLPVPRLRGEDWATATLDDCKRKLVYYWRDDRWQGGIGVPDIDDAITRGEVARIIRRVQELTSCPQCGSTNVRGSVSAAADILSDLEPDEPPPEPTAWACEDCGHRWGEWRAGG